MHINQWVIRYVLIKNIIFTYICRDSVMHDMVTDIADRLKDPVSMPL